VLAIEVFEHNHGLVTLASSSVAPSHRPAWSSAPAGIYSVSARATTSDGLTTNSDTAVVLVDTGGAPALTITPLGPGSNAITEQDILGRTYQVQFATNPQATNWQALGTATANSSGTFQFIDSNAAPERFYRTLYP
jgi:hypothetical protein